MLSGGAHSAGPPVDLRLDPYESQRISVGSVRSYDVTVRRAIVEAEPSADGVFKGGKVAYSLHFYTFYLSALR
jgi:hypothetical protein